MAKLVSAALRDANRKMLDAVMEVLWKYGQQIYNAIPAELKTDYTLTRESNRVLIRTESEVAAYIEFGTGEYAGEYLAGRTQEMRDDAIMFFVTGTGTMPARPYLFPAFYSVRDEILREADKAIQRVLDNI